MAGSLVSIENCKGCEAFTFFTVTGVCENGVTPKHPACIKNTNPQAVSYEQEKGVTVLVVRNQTK